jgi:hypothetical protein
VFTNLDGLVLQMADGAEFQVTVTQSRYSPRRNTGQRLTWQPRPR